jgi:dipeptidyl aminopeptidase/acylaminoacyl peptidase
MDRDLRETETFKFVEAFFRSALEPGFGRVTSAADPEPSPDGRWIAFAGPRLEKLEGHDEGRICLAAADGSGWRQITDGPHDDAEPHWSPDGTRLTFRSDRVSRGQHQLFVLGTDMPGEATRLGSLPGAVEWHAWSADGSRILAGIAGGAAEQADALGSGTIGPEAAALPSWIPEVESSDLAEEERRSLWLVAPDSGEVRRVSLDGRNVWEASWCGPGHAAAITSEGPGEDAWYRAGLALIDLDSGDERALYTSDVQLGWAEGSPDGARIAVIEAVCSDRIVVAGDLLVVGVANGAVAKIDTGGVDITHAYWRDDHRLAAFGRRGMTAVVLEIDVDGGTVREGWSTSESIGFYFHPDGHVFGDGVVVAMSSHRRPPVRAAVADGAVRVIADFHHAGHDAVMQVVGGREVIEWQAPDGLTIDGLLTTPVGEGPFPLVLDVHGGPVGAMSDRFVGAFDAVLLARGFATFTPDPRGSSGRGRDFASRVVGDMGGADLQDLLTGVEAVVAAGVADPDRLVLTGGSYGGFMSAWIPTQDQRFKASVAISPVTDWWSERFDSSLGAWVGDFLGGEPHEVPEEYTARSPVLQARNVTTPVLLTAGRHDRATPIGQAVEFYRALRELGVPSEVVKYPEEGHGVGEFPALLDLATRTVMWFERFLPAAGTSR